MTLSFLPTGVIDCHIHFPHPDLAAGLLAVLDEHAIQRGNIVCTPHRARLSLVPDALLLKASRPDRITVFGGLDISALFLSPGSFGEYYAQYVRALMEMGCDGIKMIEGKPDMRKTLPIPPFDSPPWEPYWQFMEESGIPLLWHVNDPEEFWDRRTIPDWAVEQGWFYGDGSFINNEAQYAEVRHVLERHPRLKVIFAHFFFLSNQLDRLAEWLDRFPGMHVDLTPGIEMYHNLGANPARTRDFFLHYPDRILYGTDIGAKALLADPSAGMDPLESGARVRLVRSFLEREGAFRVDAGQGFLFGKFAGDFQGIALPPDALQKIYHDNFTRLAGAQPRPLQPQRIAAECGRLLAVIPAMGAAQPGVEADASIAARALAYFSSI